MPAFNFQERFADVVESGQKRQTIRQTAKGQVGAIAYLYTGQRTKLGEGVLTQVLPIEIGRHACGEPYAVLDEKNAFGQRAHLVHEGLDALARDDGFAGGDEMVQWFEDQYRRLPFSGYLHQWSPRIADDRR